MIGFQGLLKELLDFAGQHEVISEDLNNRVQKDLLVQIQESKQERKKVYHIEHPYPTVHT